MPTGFTEKFRVVWRVFDHEAQLGFWVLFFLSLVVPVFEISFLFLFATALSIWQADSAIGILNEVKLPNFLMELPIYKQLLSLSFETHLLLLLGATSLSFLSVLLVQYIHLKASSRRAFSFSNGFYRIVAGLDYAQFADVAKDRFVGVLGLEAQRFGAQIIVPFFSALAKLFTIIAIISFVLTLTEPSLLYAAAGVALLYAIVSILNFKSLVASNIVVGDMSKQRVATLEEFRSCFFLIKSRHREGASSTRFHSLNQQMADAVALNNFLLSMPRKVVDLVFVIALLGAIWLGATQSRIAWSAIEIAAIFRLIPLLQMLTFDLTRVFSHLKSLRYLVDLLIKLQIKQSTPPGVAFHQSLPAGFSQIHISYSGDRVLSFDDGPASSGNIILNRGEILGLSGPSGTGKSLFSKELAGFSFQREVEVFAKSGSDFLQLNTEQRVRLFEYCPQAIEILNCSLAENILVKDQINSDDLRSIENLINTLELSEFVNTLSSGLSTPLDASWNTLSGGELQRLAILRALLSDKEAYILDETLSGMNVALKEKTFGLWRNFVRQGKFCVIVSHDKDVLSWCDRVVWMDEKTAGSE